MLSAIVIGVQLLIAAQAPPAQTPPQATQPAIHEYNLGIAAYRKGDLVEAVAAFDRAIAIFPD